MGLDMYAFSLDRSADFSTPRDVLNYRVPAEGKGLPEGLVLGVLEPELLTDPLYDELKRVLLDQLPPAHCFYLGNDLGGEFVDSKYVIPGSTLIHRWRKHPNPTRREPAGRRPWPRCAVDPCLPRSFP